MAISIEKTGRSFEEAKKAALEELKVPEDRVSVEILEDKARGFLGLSGRLVRIRVTVLESGASAQTPEAPPAEEKPSGNPGEVLELAKGLLESILRAMRFNVSVKAHREPDKIVLEMQGPDVPLLIGHHGQTLNALQYLLYVMVCHKAKTKVSLMLDAEGYRERREQALRRLALQVARQVRETGQEAVMEPMPPAERRIIHLALVNEPGVTTYSEGEEPDRRVIISPTG